MRLIDADALIKIINGLSSLALIMNGFRECADKCIVEEIVKIIEHMPTIEPERKTGRWIPCSERLPEEYGNYLATMDDGDVQECTYSPEKNTPFMRGGWSTCEADGIVFLDIAEVIAWMPLPSPYKEGAQL